MKKLIIGSLVAAILMFAWQALSWTVIKLHDKTYMYTPAQDNLLQVLGSSLQEEGQYMIPRVPDNASQEQMEELGKKMDGHPWASIIYHKQYEYGMAMRLGAGFIISLVCSILLCFIIARFAVKNFWSILWTALAMGFTCFLFVWYNGHVWFQMPWSVLNPELVDDLVSWGLAGVWLGWWYGKKVKAGY